METYKAYLAAQALAEELLTAHIRKSDSKLTTYERRAVDDRYKLLIERMGVADAEMETTIEEAAK